MALPKGLPLGKAKQVTYFIYLSWKIAVFLLLQMIQKSNFKLNKRPITWKQS